MKVPKYAENKKADHQDSNCEIDIQTEVLTIQKIRSDEIKTQFRAGVLVSHMCDLNIV